MAIIGAALQFLIGEVGSANANMPRDIMPRHPNPDDRRSSIGYAPDRGAQVP